MKFRTVPFLQFFQSSFWLIFNGLNFILFSHSKQPIKSRKPCFLFLFMELRPCWPIIINGCFLNSSQKLFWIPLLAIFIILIIFYFEIQSSQRVLIFAVCLASCSRIAFQFLKIPGQLESFFQEKTS